MAVTYRKATHNDVELLIRLRLDFLTEDRAISAKTQQRRSFHSCGILCTADEQSFVALLAEDNGQAVSAVFMAVAGKPANPSFITGKTATILNVYTYH